MIIETVSATGKFNNKISSIGQIIALPVKEGKPWEKESY
jgi:hypothetical protein